MHKSVRDQQLREFQRRAEPKTSAEAAEANLGGASSILSDVTAEVESEEESEPESELIGFGDDEFDNVERSRLFNYYVRACALATAPTPVSFLPIRGITSCNDQEETDAKATMPSQLANRFEADRREKQLVVRTELELQLDRELTAVRAREQSLIENAHRKDAEIEMLRETVAALQVQIQEQQQQFPIHANVQRPKPRQKPKPRKSPGSSAPSSNPSSRPGSDRL